MELDFAILATAAEANDGRLNLLGGGFDIFYVSELPAAVPPFCLAACLVASREEIGLSAEQSLKVLITGPDGKKVTLASVDGIPFNQPKIGDYAKSMGVFHISIIFELAGLYKIDLTLNDKALKTLNFNVVLSQDEAQ
jgi:hypothetical protein